MIKRVEITAFCHPTEDMKKVKRAFSTISPIEPIISRTHTHFDSDMYILNSVLTRKGDISKFVEIIKSMSKGDRNELLNTLDSRVDENGNLYVRFDKFAALNGDIKLGDNTEPVSVTIKFVSYPFDANKIIHEMKELLENGIL